MQLSNFQEFFGNIKYRYTDFFTTRGTGRRRHELKLYKPQPAGSVGYHNFLQLDYTGVEWISSALCIHITRCKNGPKSSQSPVVIIVLHVTRITR